MPGKRISELTALSGAGSANNDDLLIFDSGAGETKRISRSQLAEGMVPDLPLQYYLGVLNANPTQRLNGDALQIGDFYLDAVTKYTTVYNGSGWNSYASVIAAQAAAEAARDAAIVARNAAQLAQTNAETAETNAETAETNAETAETNAETAKALAETAEANAEAAQAGAEAARDAAHLAEPSYTSTAAALGNGIQGYISLVAGSGGTNGTFPLLSSGGTQVSPVRGYFVVSGGAVTEIVVKYPGYYTSNPTGFDFSASTGLAGASATPVMGGNVGVGEHFTVPETSEQSLILYRVDSGPAATELFRYPGASQVAGAFIAATATPGAANDPWVDATEGQTFSALLSPNYLSRNWAQYGFPTVRVEKGWGTGVFQDLYPNPSGILFLYPFGIGPRAKSWAGSSRLFVHRIYNQSGTNPDTDYISALADDKRVLLDLTTEAAPAFAGYSTGTQDPNQHATERGYELPHTITLQTNDHPITMLAIHAHDGVGNDTVDLVQDDVSNAVQWKLQSNPSRHYPSWAIVVRSIDQPAIPGFYQAVSRAPNGGDTSSRFTQSVGQNGVFYAGSGLFASSATSYTLNLFGPSNSLQGKCYAVMIAETEPSFPSMLFDGLPSKAARLYANAIETDKPSIAFPYDNAVVPMDLTTETADIPIKLFGKPLTAYEAQWQSGGYATIGTTDAFGVLDGALTGQAKGNGTLDVREVGGSTPISFTNVAVGIVVYAMGESGADGRGSDVTVTIPTGSLRRDRVNWTAASKEWWKLLLQNLYDEFSCVIGVTKVAAGSSYFRTGATKGMWSAEPAVLSTGSMEGREFALAMQADFLTPNFWIWDIGKNDAALNTPEAVFEEEFTALLTYYRSSLNNSDLKFWHILSGDNTGTADDRTDTIRRAQKDLWGTSGFEALGSFAHLEGDLDGVHFDTQVQKQKAADVAYRHIRGNGRAPQYASGSVSGSDLVLTFTGGVSPLTLSGTLATDDNGWSIEDDNGARTISAMAVSGLQLTITCDQALVGTVHLQFASGDTSQGTTLLDSDGTTPLPPEPFGPVDLTV